jgi:serine/threonine-protein kinase
VSIWYRDMSLAKTDPRSKRIIGWLASHGGWGLGRFQIDFSMEVLVAGKDAPLRTFEPTSDFYWNACDMDQVPVPLGGAVEGESGYECKGNGDCHLIVYDPYRKKLYEMWRANIVGKRFNGGCLVVWDLTRSYGVNGRGLNCTSADAAGLPITPLLATADEVAAGAVNHALRFILPNRRIRNGEFVPPATHSTEATKGPELAPAYGTLFRLRGDYPVAGLTSLGARVIARALQKHGMFLADAGNVVLTVRSDRSTRAKWKGLLGPHDLRPLRVADFEVVDTGQPIPFTGECQRE